MLLAIGTYHNNSVDHYFITGLYPHFDLHASTVVNLKQYYHYATFVSCTSNVMVHIDAAYNV